MNDVEGQHTIAGKYQLLRQLGRGAMGSVWQARHLTLRSSVAVKLMDPAIGLSTTGLARFTREARAAASLRSPHVVQVLDHGVDQGTPYIVMEMLEGESLAARLERVKLLSAPETARIVNHVARALARAERAGVVHRDLKPDNVFLVTNEDEELAKVLDFGIAKVHAGAGFEQSQGEERTAAGALLGTPYYVSPEQAEGLKTVDHRTDIWSLGVMTYECLLGKRPFDGETLPALLLAICSGRPPRPSAHGAVPLGFDAWFARACAHSPEDRFASARDAAIQLLVVCGTGAPAPRAAPKVLRAPLNVPKLVLSGDDDADEEEAATEIWRGAAVEEALEAAGLQTPQPEPPAVPPPPEPRPLLVQPVQPEAVKADSRNGFSRTARSSSGDGGMGRRLAVLAGLVVLGSGVGLWLGSRPTTIAQLPAATPSKAAAPSSAPGALPSVVASPSSSPMHELPPSVSLNELPLAPAAALPAKLGARAAPSAQRADAKPAAAEVQAPPRVERAPSSNVDPADDLPNPYR